MDKVTAKSPKHFPSTLIRASAGSGKTTSLTNRYISLLLAGENPSRILATSYTRKAANEIKQRVFMRLAKAALDAAEAKDLAQKLEINELPSSKALQVLKALVDLQHRIKISTLDSFFSEILNSFCLQLGIAPAWRIIEADQANTIKRASLSSIFQRHDPAEISSLLRLINKGASSRSLHESMQADLSTLVSLYYESEAAAWDFLELSPQLKKDELEMLTAKLADVPLPLNKTDKLPAKRWQDAKSHALQALAAEDWDAYLGIGLVKKIIAGEEQFDRKAISADLKAIHQRLLQQAKAVLMERLKRHGVATYTMLTHFCTELQELKQRQASLEYEDVRRYLAQAAIFDNCEELYYRLDSRIAHLLLDEFQDTSRLEWLVLEPFVQEILSKAQIDNSFFCVGDSKQAIYGWRGGVAEIFALLDRHPSISEHQSLDTSYRSAPQIIEIVNKVFGSLQDNLALSEHQATVLDWQQRFAAHQAHFSERQGYVELRCVAAQEKFDQDELEQDEEDSGLLSEAAKLVAELNQSYPHLSIGLLFRSNKPISRMMYELSKLPVPVYASEEGGNPLSDSPAVVLILTLLVLLDHPGDSILAFRLASSPLGPPLGIKNWGQNSMLKQSLDGIRLKVREQGLAAAITEWSKIIAAQFSRREQERLKQLIMLAAQAPGPYARFSDFVKFVCTKKMESPSSAAVRVMTIHRAKGLEFDAVILPELDQQIFNKSGYQYLLWRDSPLAPPTKICGRTNAGLRLLEPQLESMYAQMQADSLKEALSVLYVALTRARYGLYMLSAKSSKQPTFASILRSALLVEGQTDFTLGNPDWPSKIQAAKSNSSAKDETASPSLSAKPASRRALAFAARQRRFVHTTPSSQEGGGKQKLESKLSLESKESMIKGSLMHKLFEQVSWLDQLPSQQELMRILEIHAPSRFDLNKLLEEFNSYLRHEQLRMIFDRARYAAYAPAVPELFREQSFAFRDQGGVCQGNFDRLVLCSKAGKAEYAEVIDFKTDKIKNNQDQGKLLELYQPQIQAYKQGVSAFCGLDQSKISGVLVFVQAGQVVSV